MNGYNSRNEASKHQANRALELAANSLYNKVAHSGLLDGLKRLFGRGEESTLCTLNEVLRQIHVQGSEALGEMTVELDKVRGTASAGRGQDFDVAFRPMREHNKERWLGVAAARMCGRRLGRVKVVQVGDIFFVEDGHHRISVAKAMGEQAIEADVVRVLGSGTLSKPTVSEKQVAGVSGAMVPAAA